MKLPSIFTISLVLLVSLTQNLDAQSEATEAIETSSASPVDLAAAELQELICTIAADFSHPNHQYAIDTVRRRQFRDARFDRPIIEVLEEAADSGVADLGKIQQAMRLFPHSTIEKKDHIDLFFRCYFSCRNTSGGQARAQEMIKILDEFPNETSLLVRNSIEDDGVKDELLPFCRIIGNSSEATLPMLVKASKSENVEESLNAMRMLDTMIESIRKHAEAEMRIAATGVDQVDPKFAKYAERVIQRYDTNEDGQLTSEEWSSMLLSPKAADANEDGLITVPEYAGWMQARSRR